MRIVFHGEYEPGGARQLLGELVCPGDDVAREFVVPDDTKWLQVFPTIHQPVQEDEPLVTGSGPCHGEHCRHVSHGDRVPEARCENPRCQLPLDADPVIMITTKHVRRFCTVDCIAEGQQVVRAAAAGRSWP